MIENSAYERKAEQSQKRDRRTLEAIAEIYCSAHHRKPGSETSLAAPDNDNRSNPDGGAPEAKDPNGLCPKCAKLIEYAMSRTTKCPNNHEGNCADCEIHCFNATIRKQMREIMSFAAPRMLFRHPIMTIRYLRKKKQQR